MAFESATAIKLITSSTQYDHEVNNAGGRLVVAYFGNILCQACAPFDLRLRQLETQYAGRLVLLQIHYQQLPDVAKRYNVSHAPFVVFIKNRKVLLPMPHPTLTSVDQFVHKNI